MKRKHAHDLLVEVVRQLVIHKDVQDTLAKLKARGRKELKRRDFLWRALVRSISTMGNARGWAQLDYDRIAFASLKTLQPSKRRSLIDRTLRAAGVRMYPPAKSDWLTDNFETIAEMGGPTAAKKQLLDQEGRQATMKFLRRFKGIGKKYSRNIMMDAYHKNFRDSIAVDVRIKRVSEALGLDFDIETKDGYEECEQFYLTVAHNAGTEGWELDRIIFNYTDEVLQMIHELNGGGHKQT